MLGMLLWYQFEALLLMCCVAFICLQLSLLLCHTACCAIKHAIDTQWLRQSSLSAQKSTQDTICIPYYGCFVLSSPALSRLCRVCFPVKFWGYLKG